MRALVSRSSVRAAWLGLFVLGVWVLLRPAVHIFGEHLRDVWAYESWEAHRFTSMAMLRGSLRYHVSLGSLVGDEQVHDGAGYTNWGFGVPLLQLPFHAAAVSLLSLPARFFPDRAILFVYLAVAVPLVWLGFARILALRERPAASRLRRVALAWAATAFVVCTMLYPLIASRLQVYDETIAYFVMVELVALSAYAFLLGSAGALPVAALAVAAGLGLLVRPTGAIFLGVWSALALLERRSWRTVLVFAGGAAPFVVFWLASNWVRTGSPLSLGFQNSLPGSEHVALVRFGSLCVDTTQHTMQVALGVFRALFMAVSHDPDGWMKACGLSFELRDNEDSTTIEPFLGAAVLVFLAWTLLHFLVRRERRLELYVPYLAVVCLFGLYVYAGAGLAWRYVGDFWPLVVLTAVQYVRTLPAAAAPLLGWPLAGVLSLGAVAAFHRDVEPGSKLVEDLDASRIPDMWAAFQATRSVQSAVLPSRVRCGKLPDWPRFNVGWRSNVAGWFSDCTVESSSEIFLGVPPGRGDSYVIRFATDGISADQARIYVNGRTYAAHRTGNAYEAAVRIPYESLSSPVILATIEWEHGVDPVPGHLLEVDLE